MRQGELFAPPGSLLEADPDPELPPGMTLLRGRAPDALADLVPAILAAAPPRRYAAPGGGRLSVAMSACGPWGWISDAAGYRYAAADPLTGRAWPAMPPEFAALAAAAAGEAGYPGFAPDSCLINLYEPGARMGLHRDRDESDPAWPIVSLSFGAPGRFLIGGARRRDQVAYVLLRHGDVLVFGGPSRLIYHGLAPVRPGPSRTDWLHELRLNLTLRRAR